MDMREQILTSAQKLVQQRGFNGFSYADIAKEVGIRKASLHHHFPTKNDLCLSLIDGYTSQLNTGLMGISESVEGAYDQLKAYVGIYRNALNDERMCLGGMLATEALTLDASVLPNLKHFFTLNIKWLTQVLTEGVSHKLFKLNGTAENHARLFLSSLQGALLISRATGDTKAFNETTSLLILNLLRKG